jgi:Predicted Co/Zn/Cd cation transporters
MPDQPDSIRAVLYSLGANLAIAVAKFVGALLTASGALLAEALHSVADSGNEGLAAAGSTTGKGAPFGKTPARQGPRDLLLVVRSRPSPVQHGRCGVDL